MPHLRNEGTTRPLEVCEHGPSKPRWVAPAPVVSGQAVAALVIDRDGVEIGRYPLYADADVARKGFMGRVGAAIVNKIRG